MTAELTSSDAGYHGAFSSFFNVCVCVCVCVFERDGEKECELLMLKIAPGKASKTKLAACPYSAVMLVNVPHVRTKDMQP